jgi:SAM-dependent methyltransferase
MFYNFKTKLTKIILIRITGITLLNFFFCSKFIKAWFEKNIFNPYIIDKDENINYAEMQLKNIMNNFDIADKTILEIGPGGSYYLGCLLLKNGAKKIFVIDNENHNFYSQKELDIYEKIYPNSIKNEEINPEKIKVLNYKENSTIPLPSESIDIVYSCAVFEHVFEPEKLLANCQEILKKNGNMYHQIDLRDHIFSQDSLFFLKIPNFIFNLFFKNTGMWVNRLRYSDWQKIFLDLKMMRIICLHKQEYEIAPKKIPNEDLKTYSLLVTLKKI